MKKLKFCLLLWSFSSFHFNDPIQNGTWDVVDGVIKMKILKNPNKIKRILIFSQPHCRWILLTACLLMHLMSGFSSLYADDSDSLFNDLLIVEYINRKIAQRMPVTYDFYQQGGYFNMPSARMGEEGEIGVGYSYVHHYRNYSLRAQLFKRLEVSGSYRVFRGVDDPILTPLGFGDLSDKGANLKLALLIPEDSDYKLPGLAFGLQDFIGTKNFMAKYVVLTQVFINHNLEVSLGMGLTV